MNFNFLLFSRPHPHKLLEKGKSSNPSGEYSVTCTGEDVTITFDKMGIQCVKRDDMSFALTNRKNKKIDPFKSKCLSSNIIRLILLKQTNPNTFLIQNSRF